MSYKLALTSSGPLSGKSTLAKYLESEHGFIRADHSRTLVQSFVDTWNNTHDCMDITVEEVYAEKEEWRQALQQHSLEVGFSDPGHAVYWTKRTLKEWLSYKPQRNVVFDSFRGELQAQTMRDLGFMVVQLQITEEEREYRAIQLGKDYTKIKAAMDARPDLEKGIAKPDLTLNSELPLDVQARILWTAGDLFESSQKRREDGGLRVFGSTYYPRG